MSAIKLFVSSAIGAALGSLALLMSLGGWLGLRIAAEHNR
jgi:hypothetical protein